MDDRSKLLGRLVRKLFLQVHGVDAKHLLTILPRPNGGMWAGYRKGPPEQVSWCNTVYH